MTRNLRALFLTVLLGFPVLPAMGASDPVFAARKAAEDLQSATRSLRDARIAKDRVAALSDAVRAYEDGLRAMRESLRKAAVREQALRLHFERSRDRLSRLLGVLQTLQRASTPLLLIHPSGPLGTARSGQVLSEITPALHAEAEELRTQLEELSLLQGLQQTALDDLQAGLDGVQTARVALNAAITERTDLPMRLGASPDALQMLAAGALTLEGFARGLADLPFDGEAPELPPFSQSKGTVPLPVFGTLLRGYNEADAAGLRRPGLIISAPPVALVKAPLAATIRYLGPFLDYGNVIILEPELGYLIILAGLGQVYGEVGQILSTGDPIGLMSGNDPSAEDFLVDTTDGVGEIRQETLYIEIRQGRKTVDPGDWFALKNR